MNIRKFLKFTIVLPLIATTALCFAAEPLELLQPGKLLVATEGTYPPFSMRSADGKLDGLEIRVMKEVAKRLNLEYTPILLKWDSLLIGLQANQYDVISSAMDITAERQKSILFSDGWLESGARVVTRASSPIKSAADLKGKTVGALFSSTFAKIAQDAGATVKPYKSETDAMQDLINENVDAVITDSISASYLMKTVKLPVTMTPDFVSRIQKGFALKMDKRQLVAAINKALTDMKADGTYARLTSDLVGYDPAPQSPIRTLPR